MDLQNDSTVHTLQHCTVLGASGFPFAIGETISLAFGQTAVACLGIRHTARFLLLELADFSIGGPGTVASGGGFVGKGIDTEGRVIAGLLNQLTAKTKVHTFLTLITHFGELHLHYDAQDPASLRIQLAQVFTTLRRQNPAWRHERLQAIALQVELGKLNAQDAEPLRSRLDAPPDWAAMQAQEQAAAQSRAQTQHLLEGQFLAQTPQGLCPNCDKTIPLTSETCPFCNANFGQYASWKVLPLL